MRGDTISLQLFFSVAPLKGLTFFTIPNSPRYDTRYLHAGLTPCYPLRGCLNQSNSYKTRHATMAEIDFGKPSVSCLAEFLSVAPVVQRSSTSKIFLFFNITRRVPRYFFLIRKTPLTFSCRKLCDNVDWKTVLFVRFKISRTGTSNFLPKTLAISCD